jgi:hypothetical protein
MCGTLLALGLFTGIAVVWGGNSIHSKGVEIVGAVLLVAAVVIAAMVG